MSVAYAAVMGDLEEMGHAGGGAVARTWLTASLVVALAVCATTGLLLLVLYEPRAHFWGFPDDPASLLSRVLLAVDTIARQASVVLSLVWVGISLRFAPRDANRRVTVLLGGLVVVVCCLAAWYFTSLVRGDQIALWAVTVGTNTKGYFPAATSDQVRFVLADGSEISQGTYSIWLSVYLGAPLAAMSAVAIGWVSARPKPTHRPYALTYGHGPP